MLKWPIIILFVLLSRLKKRPPLFNRRRRERRGGDEGELEVPGVLEMFSSFRVGGAKIGRGRKEEEEAWAEEKI